jgi:hypothetical protein
MWIMGRIEPPNWEDYGSLFVVIACSEPTHFTNIQDLFSSFLDAQVETSWFFISFPYALQLNINLENLLIWLGPVKRLATGWTA